LTPSATGTRVVADTPTVTATPTRTATATPNIEQGQVIAVLSGDIITVLLDGLEVQVKYLLIDAPAVDQEGQGGEPFGPEALAFNRQLVQGRTVRLEQDKSQTDEAGRLLRYVFVDERLVNEELLRQGLARVVLEGTDRRYARRFQEVEQGARQAGVGIWSVDNSGGF
jgi:micrococcal nuclease